MLCVTLQGASFVIYTLYSLRLKICIIHIIGESQSYSVQFCLLGLVFHKLRTKTRPLYHKIGHYSVQIEHFVERF